MHNIRIVIEINKKLYVRLYYILFKLFVFFYESLLFCTFVF